MIATIRDRKGQGDGAIFIRLRNSSTEYWNFQTQQWGLEETSACRQFLIEYPDSSTVESRYQIELPSSVLPAGLFIVEYVHISDASVIGEEEYTNTPPIVGPGSNQVTVTATDGAGVPQLGVLVQAWKNGVLQVGVLTDAAGQVVIGLAAGPVTLVLTKTSWGAFPQHTMTVVAGSQSVTIQGTANPPGVPTPIAYGVLIPVGDVSARLQMGFSVIEMQSSDNESASWEPLTAPVATATLQAHIQLMPGVYAYSFLDPLGTSVRRYRWRYSANGAAPFSPFFPWVYGNRRVSSSSISIGTMRFVGVDGMISTGTIIISSIGPLTNGTVMADTKTVTSDENGLLVSSFVRGSTVRIAIEGSSIVRNITIPDLDTFDIMQALADAPDMFTVQTVQPLLTRRSL